MYSDEDLEEFIFLEDMPEKERNKRLNERNFQVSKEYEEKEWNSKWKDDTYPISLHNASKHLKTAEN